MRTLQELNVLDDFLFNEMTARGEEGVEFCKILLETILDRPLRNVKVQHQRKVQGRGTSQHGIVIDAYIEVEDEQSPVKPIDAEIGADIYDVEPNSYKEKSEARRGRYYHALIDSKILRTGIDYKNMKNVTIILILPYDPFGKDRMVYTIMNQCKEDSSVEYADGLKTIYLYTKGKAEEGTGQKLRDMLRYIENSTEENAVNEDLKKFHEMVNEIKQDEEVGIKYMKIWERESYIRREGQEAGRMLTLVELIKKKYLKGKSLDIIAEELEEAAEAIQPIYEVVKKNPEETEEKILELLKK